MPRAELIEHGVKALVVPQEAVARTVTMVGAGAPGIRIDVEVELDPARADRRSTSRLIDSSTWARPSAEPRHT